MSKKTAITPTREENFPEWYQQVVKASDMAENSPVRGCMVIKPWGFGIWENIQKKLDAEFKRTGHQNAYFPLFIPISYMQKEAKHVEGFATECAVVTHHRLEKDEDGVLQPAGELEEPLIVRPTSEMIIGESFSRWIESHRDLPLKLNQWANVVRWEMRTRIFLRTAEILWQEGHTAHATKEEAMEETLQMLDIYVKFIEEDLAIPLIKGEKTESERFPGADATFTFEAMMQDGKALQNGTSHFLGQNFSKAADIKFMSKEGNLEYAWTTSWGVTTRMIGAMIMTHSDDDGLVLPPRIATTQVVIIPIIHKEDGGVTEYCEKIKAELEAAGVSAMVDTRDMRGGEKGWHWVKKGVPIRLEVGPREMEEKAVFVKERINPPKMGEKMGHAEFVARAPQMLEHIQDELFKRAKAYRDERTKKIDSKDEFYKFFEGDGGFALSHWSGDPEVEEQVKKDLGVTIRVIPMDGEEEEGTCVISGRPSMRRVVFAKAY